VRGRREVHPPHRQAAADQRRGLEPGGRSRHESGEQLELACERSAIAIEPLRRDAAGQLTADDHQRTAERIDACAEHRARGRERLRAPAHRGRRAAAEYISAAWMNFPSGGL